MIISSTPCQNRVDDSNLTLRGWCRRSNGTLIPNVDARADGPCGGPSSQPGSDCCSALLQTIYMSRSRMGGCVQCIQCRCVCMLPMMAEYIQTDFPSHLTYLQFVSDHLLSLLSYLPSHSLSTSTHTSTTPRVRVWVLAHTHADAERSRQDELDYPGRRARSSTTSNVLDACVCALVCVCTSRKSMACGAACMVERHGVRPGVTSRTRKIQVCPCVNLRAAPTCSCVFVCVVSFQ